MELMRGANRRTIRAEGARSARLILLLADGHTRDEASERIERYMASSAPDFKKKAADIIGLSLNPPARATVFCVDEEAAIQARDCKHPVPRLSREFGCDRPPVFYCF